MRAYALGLHVLGDGTATAPPMRAQVDEFLRRFRAGEYDNAQGREAAHRFVEANFISKEAVRLDEEKRDRKFLLTVVFSSLATAVLATLWKAFSRSPR